MAIWTISVGGTDRKYKKIDLDRKVRMDSPPEFTATIEYGDDVNFNDEVLIKRDDKTEWKGFIEDMEIDWDENGRYLNIGGRDISLLIWRKYVENFTNMIKGTGGFFGNVSASELIKFLLRTPRSDLPINADGNSVYPYNKEGWGIDVSKFNGLEAQRTVYGDINWTVLRRKGLGWQNSGDPLAGATEPVDDVENCNWETFGDSPYLDTIDDVNYIKSHIGVNDMAEFSFDDLSGVSSIYSCKLNIYWKPDATYWTWINSDCYVYIWVESTSSWYFVGNFGGKGSIFSNPWRTLDFNISYLLKTVEDVNAAKIRFVEKSGTLSTYITYAALEIGYVGNASMTTDDWVRMSFNDETIMGIYVESRKSNEMYPRNYKITCNGEIEDFTDYSEEDPNDHISLAEDETTLTFNSYQTETAYFYKDYGDITPLGDFDETFSFEVDVSLPHPYAYIPWCLANDLEDYKTLIDTAGHYFTALEVKDELGELSIRVALKDSGGLGHTTSYSISHSVRYFVKVTRNGSDLRYQMFDDSAMRVEDLIFDESFTSDECTFRYRYQAITYNGLEWASVFFDNMDYFASSGEQVVNGGFEDGDITGWSGTGSVDTTSPHSGTYCAHMVAIDGGTQFLHQDFDNIPKTYLTSFILWYRAVLNPSFAGINEFKITLEYSDASDTPIIILDPTSGWTSINLKDHWVDGKLLSGIMIESMDVVTDGEAIYYIDDVSLILTMPSVWSRTGGTSGGTATRTTETSIQIEGDGCQKIHGNANGQGFYFEKDLIPTDEIKVDAWVRVPAPASEAIDIDLHVIGTGLEGVDPIEWVGENTSPWLHDDDSTNIISSDSVTTGYFDNYWTLEKLDLKYESIIPASGSYCRIKGRLQSGPSPSIERIVNGGFETGDTTGWVEFNTPPPAIGNVDTVQKHSGTYSLKFAYHGDPVFDVDPPITQTNDWLPIAYADCTSFGLWYKGSANKYWTISIKYSDDTWATPVTIICADSDWHYYDIKTNVWIDDTKEAVNLEIICQKILNTDDFWIDDVSLIGVTIGCPTSADFRVRVWVEHSSSWSTLGYVTCDSTSWELGDFPNLHLWLTTLDDWNNAKIKIDVDSIVDGENGGSIEVTYALLHCKATGYMGEIRLMKLYNNAIASGPNPPDKMLAGVSVVLDPEATSDVESWRWKADGFSEGGIQKSPLSTEVAANDTWYKIRLYAKRDSAGGYTGYFKLYDVTSGSEVLLCERTGLCNINYGAIDRYEYEVEYGTYNGNGQNAYLDKTWVQSKGETHSEGFVYAGYGPDVEIINVTDNTYKDIIHSWKPRLMNNLKISITQDDPDHGWEITQIYLYKTDDIKYRVVLDAGETQPIEEVLTFDATGYGYTPCVEDDIGLQVCVDGNDVGELVSYDNTHIDEYGSVQPLWRMRVSSFVAIDWHTSITITNGTGAGTLQVGAQLCYAGGPYITIGAELDPSFEYSVPLEPMNIAKNRLFDVLWDLCVAINNNYMPFEWWIDYDDDNTFHIGSRRGYDKHDTVSFVTGVNMEGVKYQKSSRDCYQRCQVIGSGEGNTQNNTSSFWASDEVAMDIVRGFIEDTVAQKQIVNPNLSNSYAKVKLKLDASPTRKNAISCVISRDTYASFDYTEPDDVDTYNVGDDVTVTDFLANLSGSFRIYNLKVSIDDKGEHITLTIQAPYLDIKNIWKQVWKELKNLGIVGTIAQDWVGEGTQSSLVAADKLSPLFSVTAKNEETNTEPSTSPKWWKTASPPNSAGWNAADNNLSIYGGTGGIGYIEVEARYEGVYKSNGIDIETSTPPPAGSILIPIDILMRQEPNFTGTFKIWEPDSTFSPSNWSFWLNNDRVEFGIYDASEYTGFKFRVIKESGQFKIYAVRSWLDNLSAYQEEAKPICTLQPSTSIVNSFKYKVEIITDYSIPIATVTFNVYDVSAGDTEPLSAVFTKIDRMTKSDGSPITVRPIYVYAWGDGSIVNTRCIMHFYDLKCERKVV